MKKNKKRSAVVRALPKGRRSMKTKTTRKSDKRRAVYVVDFSDEVLAAIDAVSELLRPSGLSLSRADVIRAILTQELLECGNGPQVAVQLQRDLMTDG